MGCHRLTFTLLNSGVQVIWRVRSAQCTLTLAASGLETFFLFNCLFICMVRLVLFVLGCFFWGGGEGYISVLHLISLLENDFMTKKTQTSNKTIFGNIIQA